MDVAPYQAPQWGRAQRTIGRHGYIAFFPAPLPRSLDLSLRTIRLLSEADAALGRLAGTARTLPGADRLLHPYLTEEAVASSRIEGTQASVSDVYEAAAATAVSSDVQEVQNYLRAMNDGLHGLDRLPFSLRLLRDCHETLLTDARGQEKRPGEFRESQNWIGAPGDTVESALFVPPPQDEMKLALDDWERFAQDDEPQLPLLVRCGLLHYQFETIHPFLDGNGRLGRLLLVLYLVERGRLPGPYLYLSNYFERHRTDYYDRLQAVRERGEISAWLDFFLAGVVEQATDAADRAGKLVDLRERYRDRIRGSRSRAGDVIDLLYEYPVITAKIVTSRVNVSNPGALQLLRQLTDAGVLTEQAGGRGVRGQWRAHELLDLLARRAG